MAFKVKAISLLAVLLLVPTVIDAQQLPDSTVVVTANATPVPFENLSRTVLVYTRDDIDALPVRTVADVLKYASAVDIRARGPQGVQSDISVRGSSYSQVLVLVDGMRINDSQTGHHNSDFPVQLQDVDRIEILLGAGASIYGADALGATINIITRHPEDRVSGSIAYGQNGLVDGSAATYFEKGAFRQSVSFSGSRSSGFQYDRDFRNVSLSSRLSLGNETTVFASYVDKEFGANGFYGPAPSREWTNQTFVAVERKFESTSTNETILKGFYRSHGDRFLYDIRTPDLYENDHRTHAAGGQFKVRYGISDTGSLALGGELGGDWIRSSNLGDHFFSRVSLFSEYQWKPDISSDRNNSSLPDKPVALYPGLRIDYYSNFGASVSPSLSGNWWVLPRVRLRSSVGHAFRIPTFTELYYTDPNHLASSDLKPESAWSAEGGADYFPANNCTGSLIVFVRKEKNVIDWIRESDSERWRTSNIRKLRTLGFELSLERSFGSTVKASGQYSYISSKADSVNYISKYVLDYARHSFALSAAVDLPLGMQFMQTATYRRRSDGRSYWLLDGNLRKRFYKFTAGIEYTNLLDSEYQEIRGVDMPGRWFIASLTLN
ncbi:MAG: TonB-dependent receptor [Acidobacteriota bacterium]